MSANAVTLAEQFDDLAQQREAASLGMWVFLATEILFFGVLFAAYTITRIRYPAAFAEGGRHTDVLLGTIEAVILLLSSVLMTWAVASVQVREGRNLAKWLMIATACLGVAFLVLHGVEYWSEYTEHLIPGLNFDKTGPHAAQIEVFFFMYYAMTGYHSLHVIVGVVAIAVMATLTWRGRLGPERYTPVVVTGLYWHLVDIVWIFLYPLIYLVAR